MTDDFGLNDPSSSEPDVVSSAVASAHRKRHSAASDAACSETNVPPVASAHRNTSSPAIARAPRYGVHGVRPQPSVLPTKKKLKTKKQKVSTSKSGSGIQKNKSKQLKPDVRDPVEPVDVINAPGNTTDTAVEGLETAAARLASGTVGVSRRSLPGSEPRPLLPFIYRFAAQTSVLPSFLHMNQMATEDIALAWDGQPYTQQEFQAYYGYGDNGWFHKYHWCTHITKWFLKISCQYCLQSGSDRIWRSVLTLLRLGEFAQDINVIGHLHVFLFRALLLRLETLPDSYTDQIASSAEEAQADFTVQGWSNVWFRMPGQAPRPLHRVFWQRYFGHKTFAKVVAKYGITDWLRLLHAMQVGCDYHHSDEFQAAVAEQQTPARYRDGGCRTMTLWQER